jgi:hypothetical protein
MPSRPAGVPQHCRAVLVAVLAVARRRARGQAPDHRGEQRLAVQQGRAGEVEAVEVEQIEDVIPQPIASTGLQVRLQVAEVRDAPLVFRHDLAVEQRRIDLERLESRRDRWKALCPVECFACQQANITSIDSGLDAVAIELELVDPLRPPGRFVVQERQAGLYEGRQPAGASACGHPRPTSLGRTGTFLPRDFGHGCASALPLVA